MGLPFSSTSSTGVTVALSQMPPTVSSRVVPSRKVSFSRWSENEISATVLLMRAQLAASPRFSTMVKRAPTVGET